MKKLLTILFVFAVIAGKSQQAINELIRQGNDYYTSLEFDKANESYKKALGKDPANTTARYNMANALYKQDRKQDATEVLTGLINDVTDKTLKGAAWYNKGVILTKEKNLEGSIEAYKNALRQKPDDQQARENLQKALLELKKKTPPPKEQKKNKPKEDEKKQPQPQSNLSPKETEQRLKLLAQKEKEVQQRLQKRLTGSGGSKAKDW